ncbi:neuromedin-U receptor 2-like [Oculina patagonica]
MDNSTVFNDMNQTECSSSVSTAFTVALSIVSLLALAGNVLVIVTFIKNINLKTSSNYFIVNMAVSDLLCVVLNWPLYATEGMLKAGGSLFADPKLATFFCKLGIYSRTVSYVVSVLSLVLIAVERYIAIVFPLRALNTTTRTRTIFLFLSWFLPLLGVVPYFIHSEVIQIKQQTFCRNIMSNMALKIYHFLSSILFYCAPLILILVIFSLIMKYLRRRAKLYKGNRKNIQAKRAKQNENIMKIFGSVALGFFTCWTPLYIYLFLKLLHPSMFIKDQCLFFVGLFYYIFPLLSTAVNPIILIAFSSNYRTALKDLFMPLFRKCHSGSVSPMEQTAELQELT